MGLVNLVMERHNKNHWSRSDMTHHIWVVSVSLIGNSAWCPAIISQRGTIAYIGVGTMGAMGPAAPIQFALWRHLLCPHILRCMLHPYETRPALIRKNIFLCLYIVYIIHSHTHPMTTWSPDLHLWVCVFYLSHEWTALQKWHCFICFMCRTAHTASCAARLWTTVEKK